jgi:hypothetical protein
MINMRRWGDNIKMELKGTVREFVDWILLADDRNQWRVPVNTIMNFRVS